MSGIKYTLGQLCAITKGATGIQKAIPGKYPLVVTGEERKSHNEFQFDDEAVIVPLVSATGHGHASIKRIHYQTGKFALGSILCAIVPKDKSVLNAEYLYRFLNLNIENELVVRMRGMANVTLPIKEIAKIEIPLPTLAEQREFVENYKKLEADSHLIDLELFLQLSLVKQLRQAFLSEAMQGKLKVASSLLEEVGDEAETGQQLLERIKAEKAQLIRDKKLKKEKELPPIRPEEIPFEIPKDWVWCRLGDVGRISGGGTPSMANDEYWNGEIPWVSPKDMWTESLSDTLMKVTIKGIRESSTNLVGEGAILIVGRSGILKRKLPVAINEIACTVNQDMKVLTPYILQTNRFLLFMFKGLERIILKNYVKFGMTVHSLRYDEFSKMPVPLPPLSIQNKIISKLDYLMKTCDDLETSIKQSQQQNEQLLRQVLKEALEVKDELVY